MSAVFSTLTLQRLEEASRLLIGPLAGADLDHWRAEAVRAARVLMNADHALFAHTALPHFHVGESADDPVTAAYDRHFAAVGAGGVYTADPLSELWLKAYRAQGYGAYIQDDIQAYVEARGYTLDASATVRDVFRANGYVDFHGFVAPCGRDEGALKFSNVRSGRSGAGEEARPLLRALYPSFRAGLETLGRLAAHRAALHVLDAIAEPLLVLDADGRERYRNHALVQLLGADPERAAIEGVLWQLGRDLRRLAFPRRQDAAYVPAPMRRQVATTRGRYILSATLVASGTFGVSDSALVSVAAEIAPQPLAPADVQARLGLTPREAEVALLVAEGLSNKEIAARLFLAPGTVKRHLEGIFSRLGVSTRAAVTARLLQPTPLP